MKSESFLIQSDNHTQQVIVCSIADQLLKNLSVPVVFFYRKSIHHNILIDSLKKVLSDFPIFAGTLTNINNNLCIDCNNKGALFSVAKEDCTLDEVLRELIVIKKERLVSTINPQKAIANQSPIMTIKLNYFACGGMALGICWHHSIGDMHTFMCFMKAWSNTVNKEEYSPPLIVRDRDEYTQMNLEKNDNITPGVRHLNTKELLRLVFYMLIRARSKRDLQFYFSENELNNMKHEFSVKTNQKLSTNDVLCAHLFSIISDVDAYKKKRCLSIVVNCRPKIEFPQNLLGNFVTNIHMLTNQRVDPFQLAKDLRTSVDNFQRLHMNFFSTKEYIEQNGGINRINRFIATGIDPIKRTLLITSWVNSGVYDVVFRESKPLYFTPFGDYPIPWFSSISEGFSNNGLVYSAILPSKLAKKLMQENNLRKIHKYREQKAAMPELIGELGWLL